MSGSWSPGDLPNLHSENHSITSPRKNRNCIAWAAGFDTRWWWPTGGGFWLEGVPKETSLSAFLKAFATLGYEECKDGILEAGYEKVALYSKGDPNGAFVPKHAARQLSDGRWTSKLGPLEDIEHSNVEDVNGPSYGTPVRFMRRIRRNGTN